MSVHDEERLQALQATELLDSLPEEDFDRFTRLASAAVGAPVALVSLVDADRQFFKSQLGLAEPWAGARQTPLSHSFCRTVVDTAEPLVVTDAREDERVAGNLAIEDLGVVAYAGVPLLTPAGQILGSVCAIEPQPREWTEEDVARLQDVARLVTKELASRELLARLVRRNADLEDAAVGLRSLHAELEASRADAEAARDATRKWARHLAHEVRTPLYAARGLTEDLVTHAEMPATVREDVELIDATVLEALALVDEQLLAARQSAGRPIVRLSTVDVADLLHGLRGMMRPLTRPGVAFVIEEPDGIPPLRTDAGKLAQILRNLVANALRHTSAGGVSVQTRLSEDGASVAFRVRDTGEGIPAAFRERIFEEYGQVPGANNATGSGLGLPLAAGLAAVLGGGVSLAREEGSGATFTATIPVTFHHDDPDLIVVDAGPSPPTDLLAGARPVRRRTRTIRRCPR